MRFTRLLVFLGLLLAVAAPLPPALAARDKEKKEPLPIPPPQPVPATLQVLRKGSVEVPLRIYGKPGEAVRFVVRSRPEAGELSEARVTGRESAALTYTPPSDTSITSVRLSYAAQTSAGVSAPAEVVINIVDEPAQLLVPDELTFPRTLAGKTVTQELEITNTGGLPTEGTVALDAPWRLEGSATYRLEPQASQKFRITFAPNEGGVFKREVRFSSQVDRVTTLLGEADAAVAFSQPTLTLTHPAGEVTRRGRVEVLNQTDSEQTLRVKAGEALEVPETITVPAKGRAGLIVVVKEGISAAVQDTVELTGAGLTMKLRVEAPPLAPTLRPQQLAINLPPGATTNGAAFEVVVENRGASAGFWRCQPPEGFSATPTECRLEPGARQAFLFQSLSLAPGPVQAVVRFVGEQHTVEVPVSGLVVGATSGGPAAPASTKEKPRPAKPPKTESGAKAALPPGAQAAPNGSIFDTPLPPGAGIRGKGLRLGDVSSRSVSILWPASLEKGRTFRVEERQLGLDENKKLQIVWKPVEARVSATGPAEVKAVVRGLTPGERYALRVVAQGPTGPAAQLWMAEFRTPHHSTAWQIMPYAIGLALILGVTVLWQRRRMRSLPKRAAA